MQSRLSISTPPWGVQEFGHPRLYQAQSPAQQSLVSSLRHPAKALRRQMVVGELFKYVKEIRSLDNGYAFRFNRSDDLGDLLGKMAEYIVFESLNSPQLTFAIVGEPQEKALWLRVRGLETDTHDVTSTSVSSDSAVSPLAQDPAQQVHPESDLL